MQTLQPNITDRIRHLMWRLIRGYIFVKGSFQESLDINGQASQQKDKTLNEDKITSFPSRDKKKTLFP